jgi:uncharacterized protein
MKDFSREGITSKKIIQGFKLLLPGNTKTLCFYNTFTDFDSKEISKKLGKQLKGIILDVDHCISENRGPIFPENIAHLKKLQAEGLKIVIYSNSIWTKRYNAIPKGIKVLTDIPAKPNLEGFRIALNELGFSKDEIVMVGDNYLTDGGAIQMGIPFVRIKAIIHKAKNIRDAFHHATRDFFVLLSKIGF